MAVRKIKTSWWVDFTFNHCRYRKRSPDNSRAGACAYELVLRRRLSSEGSLDEPLRKTQQEDTFEEFARKWFDEYVVPNNKYSEQCTKKYILAASLIPFFGSKYVGKITAHDIELYKAQEFKVGLSHKTVKNRLSVLSKCLACAYEWRGLPGTPPKINWPKCASYRTDYLSQRECVSLLFHAQGVVYEMILMALRTGMRQGELKGLQWPSVDWQNRSVAVRHSRCDYRKALVPPKSNRERHIPLDIELYGVLFRRKQNAGYVFKDVDGQPFDQKRLGRRLDRVCKRAGMRRITWHVLRHTFASQLAANGVPLHIVQTLLGHSNVTTTMRYAHVAPSALRPAIETLNQKTMTPWFLGNPQSTAAWAARR